jgi:hypothetical protein
MSCHEIADVLFEVKEHMTDVQYKSSMEALAKLQDSKSDGFFIPSEIRYVPFRDYERELNNAFNAGRQCATNEYVEKIKELVKQKDMFDFIEAQSTIRKLNERIKTLETPDREIPRLKQIIKLEKLKNKLR